MKTIFFTRIALMGLFFALTFVSCKKDDAPNPATAVNLTDPQTGSIVDFGAVNTDVHQMSVSLSNTPFRLQNYDPAIEPALFVGNLNVVFHSNQDGIIPLGDYNFSDVFDGQAFTFHAPNLMLNPNEVGTNNSLIIIGGTVTVVHNIQTYSFNYHFLMSDGSEVDGNFTGSMDYADAN